MKRTIKALLIIIALFLFLLPIFWMCIIAIKQDAGKINHFFDWFAPPYSFETIKTVLFETELMQWMLNSFVVAIGFTTISLTICTMTAFALSKLRIPLRKVITIFILIGLMIPNEVISISQYQVSKELNILNSLVTLMIVGAASPFTVLVLKTFMEDIPNELIESARLDGASELQIFMKIILPLSKSIIAALGIVAFLQSWNSFLWPFLTLTDMEKFTLPVGIPTLLSSFNVDYVTPMAVNLLSSLPAILLFLIFQRQIMKGISLTGIKG